MDNKIEKSDRKIEEKQEREPEVRAIAVPKCVSMEEMLNILNEKLDYLLNLLIKDEIKNQKEG